ncbi:MULTISPECIES: hypothetical protein [unclassified Microbacterium]|uniref:hypothetical protein n=1 Tax=unclassified Microbacterium TaxID=2609290 RepID=UPI001D98231D|nr:MULTISPECIES: hypothetical protein [unclassified Microbacterium]CAH0149338.1 hypothetical protein SRABI121_01213 [Microbacterium sp. Bi121]HWK76852.1 hypothetical protein [Microbacterium sp.]
MILIILLAALALIGLIATFIEVHRDGFRPVATDWTRVAEHDVVGVSAQPGSYR